ncbi:hypothetical protein E2C01_016113 [Portunus trituberculatus]|uniref:Uncharacterized protein n=1 Tax=Portunus trituberculatus TaxID=210409 RepID=A0A5B7DPD4_PORTR|nr:hypothetical protein [Portunus trituberculatus]
MDRFLQGGMVDKAAQGIPQGIFVLGNSLDMVQEDKVFLADMEGMVLVDIQQDMADQDSSLDNLLGIQRGMADQDSKRDTVLVDILKDILFLDNMVGTGVPGNLEGIKYLGNKWDMASEDILEGIVSLDNKEDNLL